MFYMGVSEESFTFQQKNKGKHFCKHNTGTFTILSQSTTVSYTNRI